MKILSSPRALALAAALVVVPLVALSAPSVAAKNRENYKGPTTQVAAQMSDKPAPRGPHRPPHGKPADPSATTDGTPAPRPTCPPKPEKPTTPTGSANVA